VMEPCRRPVGRAARRGTTDGAQAHDTWCGGIPLAILVGCGGGEQACVRRHRPCGREGPRRRGTAATTR
jgi:hypothetical protein